VFKAFGLLVIYFEISPNTMSEVTSKLHDTYGGTGKTLKSTSWKLLSLGVLASMAFSVLFSLLLYGFNMIHGKKSLKQY
jgi:hypothetical protein